MQNLFLRKQMKPALLSVIMLLSPMISVLHGQAPVKLTLDVALEIAMSDNPTVKVADEEIEKKKYAQKGAYAALFPQISLSGNYSRTLKPQVMYMDGAFDMGSMLDPVINPLLKGAEQTFADIPGYVPGTFGKNVAANTEPPTTSSGDEGIKVGRDNNWSGGFSAAMPLINVALWRSLDISAIDVELAVEQARSSKIDMTNSVKKSYYSVLLAGDSYRVFKDSYDHATDNYKDIKNKYEQGLVAEYDLIRANVSMRNIEPNLLQAENAVTLAKWQLKALLGMDLDREIECEGKLTDFQNNLYGDYLSINTSLDDNSTLRQLDLQRRLLNRTLAMQKADFLPTVSLSGNYQWTSMNNDFKFKEYLWNPYSVVQLSISWPLFSGGSRVFKLKQTQVNLHQLRLQQNDAERSLQLAVKQYEDNMASCIKRFSAAQKGVEQADRGYDIARKRYDTGAGTLLEMNDAELALMQAKLNFNQSIYDYMVSKSELDKILGKQQSSIK
ncbi:MAG: TolC family protein [Tannerellaceae bacterium]|jgi:outer membrane protein TolC|nr:TolC family protein [Tannerellaceae bacterium]